MPFKFHALIIRKSRSNFNFTGTDKDRAFIINSDPPRIGQNLNNIKDAANLEDIFAEDSENMHFKWQCIWSISIRIVLVITILLLCQLKPFYPTV